MRWRCFFLSESKNNTCILFRSGSLKTHAHNRYRALARLGRLRLPSGSGGIMVIVVSDCGFLSLSPPAVVDTRDQTHSQHQAHNDSHELLASFLASWTIGAHTGIVASQRGTPLAVLALIEIGRARPERAANQSLRELVSPG